MFKIKENVNLRRLPDNTLQMDTVIVQALRSYEVSFSFGASSQDSGACGEDTIVAPYGKGKGKKGKGKKQINVLPKALQHIDNVGQDDHGRRLCFYFNLGKCDQAAHVLQGLF